jgi:hypothetical protein
LLKLHLGPADEMSANSKNQGPGRRGKLFGPMGKQETESKTLTKGTDARKSLQGGKNVTYR